MSEVQSVVIVHIDEHGWSDYHVIGGADVRLFIVDERAPDDRVYEYTARADPAKFREIIPEGAEIGHNRDKRHDAIAGRIVAAAEGARHLKAVSPVPMKEDR